MQVLHHPSTNFAAPHIAPQDTPTGSSGSDSAAGSANITANDFLELLVAEMKNQDPTADTDPNAYIDQLVQVNSLQQLIQINQDLGGISSDATSEASSAASRAIGAASRLASSLAPKPAPAASSETHPALQLQNAASPKTTIRRT